MHQLKNNVVGTLAADITAVATSASITLLTYSGTLPVATADSPFYLTICLPSNRLYNEIVKVTNVSGTTLTIVRAQRSTTAKAWTAGAYMSINVCAEDLTDVYAAIEAIEAADTYMLDEYPETGAATVPDNTRYVVVDVSHDGGTIYMTLPSTSTHVGQFILFNVSLDAGYGSTPVQLWVYDGGGGYASENISDGLHLFYCRETDGWVNVGTIQEIADLETDVATLIPLYPADILSIEAKPDPLTVAVPESTRYVFVNFAADGDTMTLTLPNAAHQGGSLCGVTVNVSAVSGTATQVDVDTGALGVISAFVNGSYIFYCAGPGVWFLVNSLFAAAYVEDYVSEEGTISAGAGSAAAPSITMGDTDTGLYRSAEDEVGVARSGVALGAFGQYGLTLTRDSSAYVSIRSQNAGTAHGQLNFYASRGTAASPASLNNRDVLGYIYGRSWSTGTTYHAPGVFLFQATQAHTSTHAGTRAEIWTTPDDSTTAAIALRVGQDKVLSTYGDVVLPSAGFVYLGGTTTAGSWRIGQDGADLVMEQYDGANWQTRARIEGSIGT